MTTPIKARILIIEDNDKIRAMLRQMLEQEGYDVVDTANGEDGIRIFRNKPADLVITDILMPKMPGSRVISTLRNDFPDLKIIAISGGGLYGSNNYLDFAKELGAYRVFKKPIQREKLLKAIKEILE